MSTPTPAVDAITTASTGMKDDLVDVAGIGLAVGVTLFVIRKGWRLLKGFTS